MVSLYQYDRADDLTIKTATSAVELYAGDSATVSARAILGETNELTLDFCQREHRHREGRRHHRRCRG